MRVMMLLLASAAAVSLSACDSPQDAAAERQADALESQAAATSNEMLETQLNNRADTIEQQAGAADGGATPENTPSTSPSQ